MKNFLLAIGLLTCASHWIACNNQPPAEAASSFDLNGARKIIDSLNQSFGSFVKQGDSAGIGSLYASDAKLLAPNGPAIQGASSIASAFGGIMKSGIAGAELKTVELWGTEALLSEEGTYTLSDKDGKVLDKGKYIVLWKNEEGNWKMYRDIFNSDMAPAPVK